MQLKPSQLTELIVNAFAIREPVVIVGKPGIGKTAIIEAAAQQLGADFIRSHPSLDDPTDGKGLPWATKTSAKGRATAEFIPIGQFEKVLTSTRDTIWLLDDFLQAPDAVQKTYMQWLHGREAAGHVLPEHVHIIIATNDRTHRAGATGMLEPIKSRATIVELIEDRHEWCTWLLNQTAVDGVPLSIDLIAEQVAFLKFTEGHTPDLFCHFDPNVDLRNSPNPRTWVKALKWLTRNQSAAVERAAIAGVVGEGAAVERMAFRQMYKALPTIDGILMDPKNSPIPTQPSVLYAVTRAVAVRTTPSNMGRVAQYAERLVDQHGEFAALLVRDASRKTPAIQQTPAFVKLMAGPLGQLVSGGNVS